MNIPAAIGLNILAAEEPQLAVVHGLVLDQAQQVSQTLNPITSRFARVSYGIVVNQRYDPKTHQGVTSTKDPRDGKKWVVDRVEWLIRQVSLVLSLQVAVVLIDGSGRDDPSRWIHQASEGQSRSHAIASAVACTFRDVNAASNTIADGIIRSASPNSLCGQSGCIADQANSQERSLVQPFSTV